MRDYWRDQAVSIVIALLFAVAVVIVVAL